MLRLGTLSVAGIIRFNFTLATHWAGEAGVVSDATNKQKIKTKMLQVTSLTHIMVGNQTKDLDVD